MSDVQNPTTATTATEVPVVTEPVGTSALPETTTSTTDAAKPEVLTADTPATDPKPAVSEPVTDGAVPATLEEKKDESAPAEKVVEPISHGQLGYKGPGLLKSLIPSKKEFWLSDDSVSPQGMNSFMRGEKQDVANPIVAWASQTGKGLLFFNKKGNTVRKSPESVLALYDATDLKKQSPHEIAFRLHGHEHVLKASSDAERDGWYMAIEKSMELGKAAKEDVRESEGYKAEMEKLNKPNVPAPVAAAVPKPATKSTEVEKPETQRKASDAAEEVGKKDKKSRSTSRGLVDRLKGKREETEAKREEKKVEKEEKKEEEKADSHDTEAATVGAVGVGAAGVGAATAAAPESPAEEKKVLPVEKSEDKVEEKPKAAKRGSIFGRIGGFGGVKSPSKEKDQKDAELKPEVPPKDDAAPQIPAPATETPAIQPAVQAVEPVTPAALETKPEEPLVEDKKDEVATPSKDKPKFLSGLSFMKRDRSVSPSATKKEEPVKAEPVKTEPEAPKEEVIEPAKIEEPITVTPAATALPQTADKFAEPIEEAPKEEKTDASSPKRNSVFGNLGRRASKAFRGMQAPKKENTTPKTEKKETETAEAATDKPLVDAENKTEETKKVEPQTIGDVVPDAIEAGKPQQSQAPPAVAASA